MSKSGISSFRAFLACLGVVLFCAAASAQLLLGAGDGKKPSGGGGGTPPAADGSGSDHTFTFDSQIIVALTTTQSNDVIALCVSYDDAAAGVHPTGIASANTTSWTKRVTADSGAHPANHTDLWYGKAASALSTEAITVTFSGTYNFSSVGVIGISGANFSGTFTDANVALPSTGTTSPVSLTTTHAADLLIACYLAETTTPTAGAGWTQTLRDAVATVLIETKAVTVTQSGTSGAIGSGDLQIGIGDAVVSP